MTSEFYDPDSDGFYEHRADLAIYTSQAINDIVHFYLDDMIIYVDNRNCSGKSRILRASRAAEARPLDASENDARREESYYSHSEGAHR